MKQQKKFSFSFERYSNWILIVFLRFWFLRKLIFMCVKDFWNDFNLTDFVNENFCENFYDFWKEKKEDGREREREKPAPLIYLKQIYWIIE